MKKLILLFIATTLTLNTYSFNIEDMLLRSSYSIFGITRVTTERLFDEIAKDYNTEPEIIKYVSHLCEAYNIDYFLMIALIEVESEFISTAHSWADAVGYCQITEIANLDVDPSLDRYDKYDNILLGIIFIDKLSNRFKGDIDTVLRYYNVGRDYFEHPSGERYVQKIKREYQRLIRNYGVTNNINL